MYVCKIGEHTHTHTQFLGKENREYMYTQNVVLSSLPVVVHICSPACDTSVKGGWNLIRIWSSMISWPTAYVLENPSWIWIYIVNMYITYNGVEGINFFFLSTLYTSLYRDVQVGN